MATGELKDGLQALRADVTRRSKTGQIREIYVEIDAAFKRGVSGKDIVALLNMKGIPITLGTFHSIYSRLKKEHEGEVKKMDATKNRLPDINAPETRQVNPVLATKEKKSYHEIKAENPNLSLAEVRKLAAAQYT